jgi:hypothetical protein
MQQIVHTTTPCIQWLFTQPVLFVCCNISLLPCLYSYNRNTWSTSLANNNTLTSWSHKVTESFVCHKECPVVHTRRTLRTNLIVAQKVKLNTAVQSCNTHTHTHTAVKFLYTGVWWLSTFTWEGLSLLRPPFGPHKTTVHTSHSSRTMQTLKLSKAYIWYDNRTGIQTVTYRAAKHRTSRSL